MTIVEEREVSCAEIAKRLTGILPSGLVARVSREFSWFTAADWLEFITTGLLLSFKDFVDGTLLKVLSQIREALEILLRRCVMLLIGSLLTS